MHCCSLQIQISLHEHLTQAQKLIFIFVNFVILILSIANWKVLVSKYKCTSSNELLAMQLISADGGISSLFSKQWFCLLDLADIYAIFASLKGPKGVHLRESWLYWRNNHYLMISKGCCCKLLEDINRLVIVQNKSAIHHVAKVLYS